MFATPDTFPGPRSLARLAGWVGLAAFTVFLVIGLSTGLGDHPARAVAGALTALAAAVPLFLVRSRLTLVFASLATVGVVLLGNGDTHNLGWFGLAVAAAWCVLAGGTPVGFVYWGGSLLIFGGEWLWARRDPGWGPWTAGVTVTVLATMLIRHEFVLVERLRAAQVDLAEQSRAEERNRIARELHDVIAHSLTVSLLHVSSARLAIEHDPQDAARALAEAERLGRQSLVEVRATMGLLRPQSPEGIVAPVPGLDRLPELVDRLRQSGANISLVLDDEVKSAPDTTGATVYRIVQEAVTNAIKHAPGAAVSVRVALERGGVDVCIDSAGPPGRGSGMGVASMEERAHAVGGTCTAGPGGRGWVVHASLPLVAQRGRDAS